jgi:hypothetical protein
MVEKNVLTPEQFKKFTFTNVCELMQRANPDFFAGTTLESAASSLRVG